jgi:hypothetical protein
MLLLGSTITFSMISIIINPILSPLFFYYIQPQPFIPSFFFFSSNSTFPLVLAHIEIKLEEAKQETKCSLEEELAMVEHFLSAEIGGQSWSRARWS